MHDRFAVPAPGGHRAARVHDRGLLPRRGHPPAGSLRLPPPSATFNGPGDLATEVKPAVKKVETRAEKLTKALAQCHKDHSKKKRKACETAAKKKFGAVKKAKKAKR